MDDPKEPEEESYISLAQQISQHIKSGNKFWEEMSQKLVNGLPPVDGKYMPVSIKNAVAWLYVNIQEEDILTIKSRETGDILYLQRGDLICHYLVAQFRIQENVDLIEDASRYRSPLPKLSPYEVAYKIVTVFWDSLHTKQLTR
jgi:hypothetical protein